MIYGVAPDDAWDPSATMSDVGEAYIANVPAGPFSVTATSDMGSLSADGLSFAGAVIGVNLRFDP